MKFEQYVEQRNELINQAETLISENKLNESEAKMQEVKDLDNKWEGVKVANANLNALKDDVKVTDIENKAETVVGGKSVGVFNEIVEDDDSLYESAWSK